MFDRDGRQQFIYIILIVSALVVTVQVMLRRNLVVDPFREDDAPRGKNRTAESVIHTESKDRQINFRLVSAESAGADIEINGERALIHVAGTGQMRLNNNDVVTVINYCDNDIAFAVEDDDVVIKSPDAEEAAAKVLIRAHEACSYIVFFTDM